MLPQPLSSFRAAPPSGRHPDIGAGKASVRATLAATFGYVETSPVAHVLFWPRGGAPASGVTSHVGPTRTESVRLSQLSGEKYGQPSPSHSISRICIRMTPLAFAS